METTGKFISGILNTINVLYEWKLVVSSFMYVECNKCSIQDTTFKSEVTTTIPIYL